MSDDLRDVLAVTIADGTIRVLGTMPLAHTERFVTMAVGRRGVETEFYPIAPAGLYRNGDKWGEKGYPA